MHSTLVMGAVEQHQNREEMMQLTHNPLRSTLDRFANESDLLALATGKSNNEVLNLKQVMTQDDRNYFVKVMEK